ncbi:MAG: cation transporter [Gammaproteobacteria bacterium]|nr:cation transporter [Gammaproteobacteria bacterium]
MFRIRCEADRALRALLTTASMNHHTHHHHIHNNLTWALVFTLAFAAVEAMAGWQAGSLALLGDAGHMVTDAAALGLAAFAAWIAKRPPSVRHSYGLGRAEIIAALVNSLFMLGIVAGIVIAAIQRLQAPQPVAGGVVMGVAALGLAVNVIVAWMLSHGEETLNTRAALLHVLGDLLGSVAALIAGAVIYFTGWTAIDPILSLVICALILFSGFRLMREALHVLMEGVPSFLDLPEIGRAMAGVQGVASVHDLHIWALSSGTVMLSAHVTVPDMSRWQTILAAQQELLHERYGIEHITLQPELAAQEKVVRLMPDR